MREKCFFVDHVQGVDVLKSFQGRVGWRGLRNDVFFYLKNRRGDEIDVPGAEEEVDVKDNMAGENGVERLDCLVRQVK